MDKMRKYIVMALLAGGVFTSCGEYTKMIKGADYEYKYEAAKSFFGSGQYSKASVLLEELVNIMKGLPTGQESLYMLAMTYYNSGDYVTAAHHFTTYYNTYPKGDYTEQARFHCGKALYLDTPEPRLDQSSTYKAIQELQVFLEFFPSSPRFHEAQNMIYELQDKLVYKEYLNAQLYYNLGSYTGNLAFTPEGQITGNNFQACYITVQNILKDFPYTKLREDLSVLSLRAQYKLAMESVEDKKDERMRKAVDEYYAFKNEYPESKYMDEVEKIYKHLKKYLKDINE